MVGVQLGEIGLSLPLRINRSAAYSENAGLEVGRIGRPSGVFFFLAY